MCGCNHNKMIDENNKFFYGGSVEETEELNNFDLSNLDFLEERMYSDFIKHSSKAEALRIIINSVEGDFSQLSPELAEIAEKYNTEYKMGGGIKKPKKWIQGALSGGSNKGSLRRKAFKEGLLRNDKEKLSFTDLHKLEKMGGKTSKRAYLAETLKNFEQGGTIDSERRFTEGDFNKLPDNIFKTTWSGYVWEIHPKGGGRVLGKFNPKTKTLFISGKKDLSNPLVKYLQENSYVSADEYDKLKDGGKVGKRTLYVRPTTLEELEEKWGFRPVTRKEALFVRCNSKGEVDWKGNTIFYEQSELRGRDKVVVLFDNGGAINLDADLAFDTNSFRRLKERQKAFVGYLGDVISIQTAETFLQRKINSWKDDVIMIGDTMYKKVYLRPEYRRMTMKELAF